MYIFEGVGVWDPSSTPAVQQSCDIRQAKLCLISHYRNYASQQVHRGWSLPLLVPPTTANFSTSIALCVSLLQEGSFGISEELCVEVTGVRVEACTKLVFVFAFWYLRLGVHEVRTTLNLKPCLQIRLKPKNVVPSHEIATFGKPNILSNF